MSKDKQYTKQELNKIINDEIKSFIKKELDSEFKNVLSKLNSDSRKEITTIVKDGLGQFAEFLFVRKGIWQNNIK